MIDEGVELERVIVCLRCSVLHYISYKHNFCPGEQHGYNVPEVREVPDMSEWLADHKQNDIMSVEDDKLLPEPMRRLLCDGYMCMYESTDTLMYK